MLNNNAHGSILKFYTLFYKRLSQIRTVPYRSPVAMIKVRMLAFRLFALRYKAKGRQVAEVLLFPLSLRTFRQARD
jgi:hypothetical protein